MPSSRCLVVIHIVVINFMAPLVLFEFIFVLVRQEHLVLVNLKML
jgi:hypothetical protein